VVLAAVIATATPVPTLGHGALWMLAMLVAALGTAMSRNARAGGDRRSRGP
jgi:hypothetical protein